MMGPPFTLNGERKIHHHERAKLVKAWRDDMPMLGRQHRVALRRIDPPYGIEVHAWCRGKADRGAYFPAAKAMIDGLIGVLWEDDSPEWIAWERHWSPAVDYKLPVGVVRVQLTIVTSLVDV